MKKSELQSLMRVKFEGTDYLGIVIKDGKDVRIITPKCTSLTNIKDDLTSSGLKKYDIITVFEQPKTGIVEDLFDFKKTGKVVWSKKSGRHFVKEEYAILLVDSFGFKRGDVVQIKEYYKNRSYFVYISNRNSTSIHTPKVLVDESMLKKFIPSVTSVDVRNAGKYFIDPNGEIRRVHAEIVLFNDPSLILSISPHNSKSSLFYPLWAFPKSEIFESVQDAKLFIEESKIIFVIDGKSYSKADLMEIIKKTKS